LFVCAWPPPHKSSSPKVPLNRFPRRNFLRNKGNACSLNYALFREHILLPPPHTCVWPPPHNWMCSPKK